MDARHADGDGPHQRTISVFCAHPLTSALDSFLCRGPCRCRAVGQKL